MQRSIIRFLNCLLKSIAAIALELAKELIFVAVAVTSRYW